MPLHSPARLEKVIHEIDDFDLADFVSVAEGFGGPYMPGTTTDVGAAIIYSLLFIAFLLVDAGRFSVDHLIEKRVPEFRR